LWPEETYVFAFVLIADWRRGRRHCKAIRTRRRFRKAAAIIVYFSIFKAHPLIARRTLLDRYGPKVDVGVGRTHCHTARVGARVRALRLEPGLRVLVRCRARNGGHLGVFQRIAVVASHLHLVALGRGARDRQFAVLHRRMRRANSHAHGHVMVVFAAGFAVGGGGGGGGKDIRCVTLDLH
jgi:hypothetical protein